MMDITHKQASIMLTLIWTDLMGNRDQKLSGKTIELLGRHFAPRFTGRHEEDGMIRYGLEMPGDPTRAARDEVFALARPPEGDTSNKHLRLDMNSSPVRGFIRTAYELLIGELEKEFPVVSGGAIESSFAFEAKRLIDGDEPDEDHSQHSG